MHHGNRAARPSHDALYLRMIRASDDDDVAAFSALLVHNPVDLLDKRARRIYNLHAARFDLFADIPRHAMRPDHNVLLGLMVMAGVAFGAWRLLKAPTEGLYPEDVLGVPVYTQLAPEGAQNRPGTKREIRYIVIHETGNTAAGADAAAHGQLEAKGGEGTTGWHYTVDDTEVWHSIPDDEVAYHAGDGAEGDGNLHGIGVELCVNADGDFEKTFDNAARLTGWLMNAYDLSADQVKEHYDFSGKNCPQTIRENGRMEEFVALAEQYAQQAKAQED